MGELPPDGSLVEYVNVGGKHLGYFYRLSAVLPSVTWEEGDLKRFAIVLPPDQVDGIRREWSAFTAMKQYWESHRQRRLASDLPIYGHWCTTTEFTVISGPAKTARRRRGKRHRTRIQEG